MHSFVSCLMHVVFSTKDRQPFISQEIEGRLWPYIGGIAQKNKMKALKVGGVADHIHVLLSLPSTLAIAKAVQLIKGNSSKRRDRRKLRIESQLVLGSSGWASSERWKPRLSVRVFKLFQLRWFTRTSIPSD